MITPIYLISFLKRSQEGIFGHFGMISPPKLVLLKTPYLILVESSSKTQHIEMRQCWWWLWLLQSLRLTFFFEEKKCMKKTSINQSQILEIIKQIICNYFSLFTENICMTLYCSYWLELMFFESVHFHHFYSLFFRLPWHCEIMHVIVCFK